MATLPRHGEQITRLVRTLAAVKGWSMTAAMAFVAEQTGYGPDRVHHWRQGKGRPSTETAEILAQIGKNEASLPREWGESLFSGLHHPDATAILNKLWGPKEMRYIPRNLPTPEHTALIGRQKESADLLALLSSQYGAHLISVDGIGGVGKTALALEVAYRCLRASTGEDTNPTVPTFDAIIFVSAKQQYLTPVGVLPYSEAQRTLRDIFHEIAQTLNRFDITQAAPQEQPSKARDALTRQRTLLIVDNLETMVESQEIVAFLYRLPPQVKVIITTRERALFSPIRLEELEEKEALNLISKEAEEKRVALSEEQASALCRRIGGIPAALVYALGQIASGYSVKTVLDRVLKASGEVARFCFEGSLAPLRGRPTHTLLMAMALFPKHPVGEAIAYTAGLASDPIAAEEGLAQLQQLSLVSLQEGRYRMLPLTREYALAELALDAELERGVRKRWVEWHLHFAREHGGNAWMEWHIQFDQVEEEWENLLAVFHWCAAHDKYDEICSFWQEGGYVLEVANIYGYWDDRLIWQSWLLQAAERRGDWAEAVQAMAIMGFTLTLLGHLDEADGLFKRGWDLRKHTSPQVQVQLAREIAFLLHYQKQFEEAHLWLDRAGDLLGQAGLGEREHARYLINAQYYRALLYYQQQDYSRADAYLREVIERSRDIGWQRPAIFAQNWLANLAIAQGRLNEAEDLLQTGLPVAERNKDKRLTAHYKRSLAHLRQKQGSIGEASRWAKEAYDSFERLGMRLDAKEMLKLLRDFQV